MSLTQLHNRIIAGHPPADPCVAPLPKRRSPGRSREPPDFCFVIILSRSLFFGVLRLMAARVGPAAHAETKLLTGPDNGPRGKGTPEGGQPMSTHNRGPTEGF